MKLEDLKGFKIPSAMIKKVFPPKKSVFTVDTNGDGKADAIKLVALNVIMPFSVPEKEDIGDINVDEIDPTKYGKIFLDGEEIVISKGSKSIELIKQSLTVYHKGDKFSFDDALGGKMGGRTIAMGDEITVVFKLEDAFLNKLTEGKHTLKIESEKIPSVEIGFELTDKSINQKLDL